MAVSPQTQEGLSQAGLLHQQEELTDQERAAIDFRSSLETTVAILAGVGPLCTDIDELIDMLTLAQKNDSQLYLIMSHMSPKRMRPMGK